jgi:hypothetical protein
MKGAPTADFHRRLPSIVLAQSKDRKNYHISHLEAFEATIVDLHQCRNNLSER